MISESCLFILPKYTFALSNQHLNVTSYPRRIVSLNSSNFVRDKFVCCCKDSIGNVLCVLFNIAIRLNLLLKVSFN